MNVVLKTSISIVAALAVAVPAASAATRPDDRPGLRGPGAVAESFAESVRPDDRAGRREVPLEVPIVTPTTAADGFDWDDAGVGAGTVGGIVALLLGGMYVARHGRRSLEQA
jgi:hypothetical protein